MFASEKVTTQEVTEHNKQNTTRPLNTAAVITRGIIGTKLNPPSEQNKENVFEKDTNF